MVFRSGIAMILVAIFLLWLHPPSRPVAVALHSSAQGTLASAPTPAVQSAVVPSMVRQRGSLTSDEKQDFDQDLQRAFTRGEVSLDEASRMAEATHLNRFGRDGVAAILTDLRAVPTEPQTVQRMAQVDYLAYRLAWDPELVDDVEEIVLAPLPKISNRLLAIILAERSELVGAIAKQSWDRASEVIGQLTHPLLHKIALYDSYHGLLAGGKPRTLALDLIQAVDPNFQP